MKYGFLIAGRFVGERKTVKQALKAAVVWRQSFFRKVDLGKAKIEVFENDENGKTIVTI